MAREKLCTTLLLLTAAALSWAADGGGHEDPPAAKKLENGVYLLKFEGEGRKVKLTDGSDAVLGKRLSDSVGTAVKLQALTNDNKRFHLHIKHLGPLPKEATEVQSALVIDGVVLHLGRPDKLAEDGTAEVGANVHNADAAKRIAASYGVEAELRKQPWYRYQVRWVPNQEQYEAGEKVILKIEIKNTGTEPMRFTHGGKQRGARDNQFRFVAQDAAGKGLPDEGDPRNFGGRTRSITLKPDEAYTAEVELTRWFKFTDPGVYRITGIFEMTFINPTSPDEFSPEVWDDLGVGECTIRIVEKKK